MARKMKNSGIEWIGEIPLEWELKRLKALFLERKEKNDPVQTDFILSLGAAYGVVPYSEKEGGGNKAKEDLSDYRLAYPNDIVMNSMNIISGSVGISKYFGCVSPVYYMLYPRSNNISPNFFCYMFQTKAFQRSLLGLGNGILIKESSNGNFNTVRMRIPMEKLGIHLLPLPTLDEQEKIASFLDQKCAEIDAVIEKTKETIEEYKKLKQSIITEAVTKGIRGNRPMKDSGIEWIGEIPVEWIKNSIKSVATTCSGGTPSSGDTSLYDGDINWICSYDLKEKPITESGRKITQKGADTIAGKMQSIGSILIAMYGGSGTIGNSGILKCEARTNQAICSVKFNNDFVLDFYGFYYILAIRKHWMIYAVGTRKDPNISQDIIKRMPCVIPPINEQQEIIDYLNQKCAEIDILIAKKTNLLTELENYKKSLIYEYVTGKKEVK